MGRGRCPIPGGIDAATFHHAFDDKVAAVRSSTADSTPPSITAGPTGFSLDGFRTPTIDDVIAAVRSLPNKQCASDPMPTNLLKECACDLAPFLTHLFGLSLSSGVVPASFKEAYITPLVKKADLDAADVRNYRPISNLSVISKLLERLVAKQLTDYLRTAHLLPDLQSAYRANHSTETAVTKV